MHGIIIALIIQIKCMVECVCVCVCTVCAALCETQALRGAKGLVCELTPCVSWEKSLILYKRPSVIFAMTFVGWCLLAIARVYV